jgi:uncharacterized protein (TIGR02284 family)
MATETVIPDLQDLIQICRDGELGYTTAADHVGNSQLRTIFAHYAKQRAGFVRDLEAETKRLGGIPSDSSSVIGALHRGWIDLKAALSGGDGEALVAACETGEDHAVAAYERVVDLELSGQTNSLVEKQWEAIKEAHAHMLRLKAEGASGGFPNDTEEMDATEDTKDKAERKA